MADVDLKLLPVLNALLAAGSVADAARNVGLSASAMSRALARLRVATGDPLLVRAGRGLVATPYAAELRERVRNLAQEAQAVLQPAAKPLDLANLERTFKIRANDGFVEAFAARLITSTTGHAPHVRLHFVPKPDKDVQPLRDGLIDLDIGVLGKSAPEVRVQSLFRDRFVGFVRQGHPLLTQGKVTPERYASYGHVVVSRHGVSAGPVDLELKALGLVRTVIAVVPNFSAALAIARSSELVALVSSSFLAATRDGPGNAVQSFPLPIRSTPIIVSQMWHPRMDADTAHRWLREMLRTTCHEGALLRERRLKP